MLALLTVLALCAPQEPAPVSTPAPAAAADPLAAALAALEAYTPGKAAPTDAAVVAALDQLSKALPRLCRRGGPVADRMRELLVQHRERATPRRDHKVHARDPLARVLVRFEDELLQQQPVAQITAHPTATAFPGAVPDGATPERRELTIDLAIPGRHSTGLYAAPAAPITVRITGEPTPAIPKDLKVRIGAHSDNIARRDAWPRLPRISRTFAIGGASTAAACAFGGLVYLEVPADQQGKLTVAIEGAVAAPRFVLGTTTREQWQQQRGAPGPWAEIGTDKVILTVPSEHVRTLDDPTAVLGFWNRVLDGAATLAARPLQRPRAERYVADLEISAGYMHAGYPIMTHLDAAADMVSLERMQKGPWGLFHELGHNHQQKEWTFGGTGEVTVNLFSLYLCETLCGMGPERAWGGNVVRARVALARHLQNGTKPWDGDDGKADLALRLLMYQQMQREFGWEPFTKVFADYLALAAADKPKDDDARRDQWLLRMSKAVGRDLGPFFVAWGLPTSDAARAEVSALGLPAWMPMDWPAK